MSRPARLATAAFCTICGSVLTLHCGRAFRSTRRAMRTQKFSLLDATSGIGSSREAAVYAMGLRHSVRDRAILRGHLRRQRGQERVAAGGGERARTRSSTLGSQLLNAEIAVDLEQAEIVAGPHRIAFAIEPVRRLRLLNGWNDLDLTDRHEAEIAAFRARRLTGAPGLSRHRRDRISAAEYRGQAVRQARL